MAEGLPQVDIDLAALPLFSVLTSTELDAVTQEFEEEYAQPTWFWHIADANTALEAIATWLPVCPPISSCAAG